MSTYGMQRESYEMRKLAMAERRRERKARWVAAAGGRCVQCGYDQHPAALDFDHIDPTTKAATVAQLISAAPTKANEARIAEEVAKCQLLCANCHRVKTATHTQAFIVRKLAAAGQVAPTGPISREPLPRDEKGRVLYPSRQLARVICRNGHPRSPANIRTQPNGAIVCRPCAAVAQQRYRAKTERMFRDIHP